MRDPFHMSLQTGALRVLTDRYNGRNACCSHYPLTLYNDGDHRAEARETRGSAQVAEVVLRVFECADTHLAAIPRLPGEREPHPAGARISMRWPHDGRSVRAGAMHAPAPLVPPCMSARWHLTVIHQMPCVPMS